MTNPVHKKDVRMLNNIILLSFIFFITTSCDNISSPFNDKIKLLPSASTEKKDSVDEEDSSQNPLLGEENTIISQQTPLPPKTLKDMIFENSFNLRLSSDNGSDFKEFRYTLNKAAPENCDDGEIAIPTTEIEIPMSTTVLHAISCDIYGKASPIIKRTYTFVGGWEILISTSSDSQTVEIYIGDPNNMEVEWGDGSIDTYSGTDITAAHSYITTGDYNIKIRGNTNHIHFQNEVALKQILTPIQGISGITSLRSLFSGAVNLIGPLPDNLFYFTPKVTNFRETFKGTTNLNIEIPANLFANNPLVTNFFGTFEQSGFTGPIPNVLFKNNPRVTTFSQTFFFAQSISGSIPPDLFENNLLVESFAATFLLASSLSGEAPDLWNQFSHLESDPTSTSACFGALFALDNFFSIPNNWK